MKSEKNCEQIIDPQMYTYQAKNRILGNYEPSVHPVW